MDDDARDTLAALDWINRQLNGFEGGDRAAVVRRLLAMDANIVLGVAEVLKIGLVCHPDGLERARGRPIKDEPVPILTCLIGAYIEAAPKPLRALYIKKVMKCYGLSHTTANKFWHQWKEIKKSGKMPE